MKVRAQTGPWYKGINFAIFKDEPERRIGVVRDLVFEEIDDGELIPTTFMLRKDEAQTLMDDLWHCGLRPSEGSGSAGQLAAVKYHLEDMRKLVFEGEKK